MCSDQMALVGLRSNVPGTTEEGREPRSSKEVTGSRRECLPLLPYLSPKGPDATFLS